MERFPNSVDLHALLGHLKNYQRKKSKLDNKKDIILKMMESVNGQVRVKTEDHIKALAAVRDWTGKDVQAVISAMLDEESKKTLIKAAEVADIPWVYHPKMIRYCEDDPTWEEVCVSFLVEPLMMHKTKKKNLGFLDERICSLNERLRKLEKKKKRGLNEKLVLEEELRIAKANQEEILALEASIRSQMEDLTASVVVNSEEEVGVVEAVKIWLDKELEILISITHGDSLQDSLISAANKANIPWIFYDILAKERLSKVRPRILTIHY
ncbi:uncharacterized protein LOC132286630 [Cornus florida]|uniref:uncharacterized protein LOC132286630 n=1 Tax=Cornus florida TaxID=4283 RepID=UPI00289C3582|nr:uncharacterized protein LOC132286630 [Cornus florida]XP_059644975.1 uncharacterized protein LOC132286630 [Cornus florida]